MSVASQDYHILFVDDSSVSIPSARLFAYDLSLVLIVDHFRQIVVTLLIALLLPHRAQTENYGF